MKTIVLILGVFVSCFSFNIATSFAAPIPVNDDMDEVNSACGIMTGTHSKTYYAENKITDTFTLGIQSTDWKNKHTVTDYFGKINGANGTKIIIGARNYDSKTRGYVGMTKVNPVSMDWSTYTSVLVGKGFHELQIGAIYELSENTDLDLSYDFYQYQGGRNSLNIGVTYKAW